MKEENQTSNLVDFSEPINFAYLFLLFDKLGIIYLKTKPKNLPPSPSNSGDYRNPNSFKSWEAHLFKHSFNVRLDQIEKAKKEKIDNSNSLYNDELSIAHVKRFEKNLDYIKTKTNFEKLLSMLKHEYAQSTVDNCRITKNPVLDRLCSLISFDIITDIYGKKKIITNIFVSWDNFTREFKDIAKDFLIKEKVYCHKLGDYLAYKNKKPSIHILFALSETGSDKEKSGQLKNGINKILLNNLKSQKLDNDKTDIKITERKSVNSESKEKSELYDIVISGKFAGTDDYNIFLTLKYEIKNSQLSARLQGLNDKLKQPSNSEKYLETKLFKLDEGEFQAEILQSVLLLLAVSNYLRENIGLTIEYLRKIPEKDRISEAWFILGVCYHDQGDIEEAVMAWKKAHDKNHVKASLNLALERELAYKNSTLSVEKAKIKAEITELIPLEGLIHAPSEIQFKAGIIYERIGEGRTAEELYKHILSNGSDNVYFQYASLFLAMLNEKVDQIKKIMLEENSIDLKKTALYYVFKSNIVDREEQLEIAEILINNLDKTKPDIQEFCDKIEGLKRSGFFSINGDSDDKSELHGSKSENDPQNLKGNSLNKDVENRKNGSEILLDSGNEFRTALILADRYERLRYWMGNNFNIYLRKTRSSNHKKPNLLLDFFAVQYTLLNDKPYIQLISNQLPDAIVLARDATNRFILTRKHLLDYLPEDEIPATLSLTIFYPDSEGQLNEYKTPIHIAVPNLANLMEEIEQLSLVVPFLQADEYYTAIQNYLTEFYGNVGEFVLIDWLCDVGLAFEDRRISTLT